MRQIVRKSPSRRIFFGLFPLSLRVSSGTKLDISGRDALILSKAKALGLGIAFASEILGEVDLAVFG